MKTWISLALIFGNTINVAAQVPCTLQQHPAYMVSWNNQPGTSDHAERHALSKGTHLSCLAFASANAACYLTLENDGAFTLSPHDTMRTPKDDVVTLSCNGIGRLCCEVQVTPDSKPIKAGESKPHRETRDDKPKTQ